MKKNTPALLAPATPAPFFIIGCVRSGTTMLRDILRRHPNLASPEETHFYRWAEPFAAPGFMVAVNSPLLRKHREMDGVPEDSFQTILSNATSRGELTARYMAEFIRLTKPTATRWFDKTPQNVYGSSMIAHDFPDAKFVHIVRNPVEVVSSLRLGKIMKIPNLVAGSAYWNEAAVLIHSLKRRNPGRVLEIRYEDFVADPLKHLKTLLEFIGEPFDPSHFSGIAVRESSHADESLLTPAEITKVEALCMWGRTRYGYTNPDPLLERKARRLAKAMQQGEVPLKKKHRADA